MRELNTLETQFIAGASIRPSSWIWGAGIGTMIGTVAYVACAVTPNPLSITGCLLGGAGLGGGFVALYDCVHEMEK